MKIILSAKLKKKELITDNRPALVSFFKNAFSMYNEDLFDKFYSTKSGKQKSFCFSIKFNGPKFSDNIILLSDESIELTIHTYDIEDGIDIYNALCLQKRKEYPLPDENSLTITDVIIRNHKTITSEEITIKMYSPLLVRKHDERKDYYLTAEHAEFVKYFRMSVEDFLNKENINLDKEIEIVPVQPKKTVPVSFGHKVTGNLGVFKLKGSPALLNLLYQSGIGSRRSQGFGLFEII